VARRAASLRSTSSTGRGPLGGDTEKAGAPLTEAVVHRDGALRGVHRGHGPVRVAVVEGHEDDGGVEDGVRHAAGARPAASGGRAKARHEWRAETWR
jgi:hypothetical protein